MAVELSSQYKYSGRGPFDAKSLVKTYVDLINENTWLSESNKLAAYNGMIVAVWLDKEDPTRNGIYFLQDPNVTSTIKAPDVTNPNNWIKIGEQPDLSALESRVDALEKKEAVKTYGYRASFPVEGETGIMYIAVDEQKTYVWYNDAYLSVGGSDYEEPEIIYGGSAD
jgi:hypothetical protein